MRIGKGAKVLILGLSIAVFGAVFGTLISKEVSEWSIMIGMGLFLIGYCIDWNE